MSRRKDFDSRALEVSKYTAYFHSKIKNKNIRRETDAHEAEKNIYRMLSVYHWNYPIVCFSLCDPNTNNRTRTDSTSKRSKKSKRSRKDAKHDAKNVRDTSFDTSAEPIELDEEICVDEQTVHPLQSASVPSGPVALQPSRPTRRRKTRRGSGTSSEEERWLDAIESGKLEQVDDELRKIKDPKLMTARQRAMYERSIDKDIAPAPDTLQALPTGYKEREKERVLTAEELEKAQLKSQKRKQLADEKREKDKQKTMDRLLKKQESKVSKVSRNKAVKAVVPVISYRSTIAGATISYPIDVDVPFAVQAKKRKAPAAVLCAVCKHNHKRYNCAKTNLPLCSLKCYKLNVKPRKRKHSDRLWWLWLKIFFFDKP